MNIDLTKPFRRLAPSVDVAPTQTDDRTFRFVFSNEKVGRDRFVVLNRGIQHANYDGNPVILWAHDDKQPPIGAGSNIDTSQSDCMIDITFVDRGILPFAGTIRDLVAGKWLRAVSLSWMPIKWKRADSPGVDAIFTEVDVLEVSVTPLPALPGALQTARSHGVDTRPIYEWAERLLDTGGIAAVPRDELETLRRAAKMPRPVQRASDTADWKVGASRDLKISDSDSWDGAAAEKAIFEYAGGDDDFSPSKARKGFLVYDAGKPEERGSYKLPIATVVDGELVVPKGAIRAAASRLPDTDIPEDVRKRAAAVLDHYKEKAGIGEEEGDEKGKEKRALQVKHTRALSRAPAVPAFRRGLYGCAQLAYALENLGYLHSATEYEADVEGDDSKVPAMLGEALKALGESLIAMTEEEVRELLEQVSGEGDEDVDADEIPPEERAFVADGKTARARAWRRGIACARAGRVLSKSNQEKLEDAEAQHERALKHHGAMSEHHAAAVSHVEKVRAVHKRATSTLAELGYDNPRVTRAMDEMSETLDGLADVHEDVKDAHGAMGRSVKAASRCVRSVLGSSTSDDDAPPSGDVGDTKSGNDKEAKERAAAQERRARAIRLLQP